MWTAKRGWSGQNDQQSESLSGQIVILVRHCPLTSCYFEPRLVGVSLRAGHQGNLLAINVTFASFSSQRTFLIQGTIKMNYKLQSCSFLDESCWMYNIPPNFQFITRGMKFPHLLCVKSKNHPIMHSKKNCAPLETIWVVSVLWEHVWTMVAQKCTHSFWLLSIFCLQPNYTNLYQIMAEMRTVTLRSYS